MENDRKTQRKRKIQLTMQMSFISSKDSAETHTMHTKSSNTEIMIGNETDGISENLFDFILQKYQDGLEELTTGSEFIRDCFNSLYYHLQNIDLRRS